MPSDRLERSLKIVFTGIAVNAAVTAVKFAAGISGHSHALTADAVESAADLLSSVIVWRGLVVAAEPPDVSHPYGHGKAEPLAAASVAIILMLAAVGIVLRSAEGLAGRGGDRPAAYTLWVLIAVVIVKERLFRWYRREAASMDNSALTADAWHQRADAITSLAAGIGIIITLVGGPKWAQADDAAALIAGVIIAWNGWRLLRPALDELMDAAAPGALVADIRAAATGVSGVRGVEKCIVRKMGFQYFVDMHVEVDPLITVQQGHEIAHNVKNTVKSAVPSVKDVLVHIEPGGKV